MRQQNGRSFGRRLAAASLGVVVAFLASCSSGQITQTATHLAAVNGDGAAVGKLQVSNATLAYPEEGQRFWAEGSDVPVIMTITNNGEKPDTLRSVSTGVASEVVVEGDTIIGAQKALTVGDSTKEVSEAGTETEAGEVGTATITLEGLSQDLFPGQVVTVTLTFANAGSVDLRVPIEAPDEPRTAEHGGSESGSGH
ncbi:MAG: copper chaperone PCu(A)C [Actinophytocola sp.]|nr:copper chaperone PCu(A)C [Actinophytocola sp.]